MKYRKIIIVFVYVLFVALCAAHAASARTIILSWNPNSESDLAGYKIFVGRASHDYDTIYSVGLVNEYQLNIADDQADYYIALKAFDKSMNESDFSEEVVVNAETGTDEYLDDPEELLLVNSQEKAPGGDNYLWKSVAFNTYATQDVKISLVVSTHQGDNIGLELNGEAFGWNNGVASLVSPDDEANGAIKIIEISKKSLPAGSNVLRIYANQMPTVHSLQIVAEQPAIDICPIRGAACLPTPGGSMDYQFSLDKDQLLKFTFVSNLDNNGFINLQIDGNDIGGISAADYLADPSIDQIISTDPQLLHAGRHTLSVQLSDGSSIRQFDMVKLGSYTKQNTIVTYDLGETAPDGERYLWKTLRFYVPKDGRVCVTGVGSALHATRKADRNDDNLVLVVDGDNPVWDHDDLNGDKTRGYTTSFVKSYDLAAGWHEINAYVDGSPFLSSVKISFADPCGNILRYVQTEQMGSNLFNKRKSFLFNLSAADSEKILIRIIASARAAWQNDNNRDDILAMVFDRKFFGWSNDFSFHGADLQDDIEVIDIIIDHASDKMSHLLNLIAQGTPTIYNVTIKEFNP